MKLPLKPGRAAMAEALRRTIRALYDRHGRRTAQIRYAEAELERVLRGEL